MNSRFDRNLKGWANTRRALGINLLHKSSLSDDFDDAIKKALAIRDGLRSKGARWQASRLTDEIKAALRKGGFLYA